MFYTFNQNNSGGSFTLDEKAGITHYVIVEAPTASRAIKIAEDIGLYFDGHGDCPCCGDRWSNWLDDDDAHEVPTVYGEPASEYDGKYSWMEKGKEIAVHYADGRIEWF